MKIKHKEQIGDRYMALVGGDNGSDYVVTIWHDGKKYSTLCTCPDAMIRKGECKHIKFVMKQINDLR